MLKDNGEGSEGKSNNITESVLDGIDSVICHLTAAGFENNCRMPAKLYFGTAALAEFEKQASARYALVEDKLTLCEPPSFCGIRIIENKMMPPDMWAVADSKGNILQVGRL